MKSILEKLYVLSDDTFVIPGHGEFTAIGHEKANNAITRSFQCKH
jgi:glyoxylase-like metal-dependent hydrolase (beta-lactamase superfamily II)